jgi:hypothetical protein
MDETRKAMDETRKERGIEDSALRRTHRLIAPVPDELPQ